MAQISSILNEIEELITEFNAWVVYELPAAIVDAASWIFRGTTLEVTLKLTAILVLLTFLFAYSFRSPGDNVPRVLNVLMMVIGVLFWGAAVVVIASFFVS